MNIKQKRKKRISIRLTDNQYERLTRYCETNNITLSKYIRAYLFSNVT
jgi:predicted DNA-binding protein